MRDRPIPPLGSFTRAEMEAYVDETDKYIASVDRSMWSVFFGTFIVGMVFGAFGAAVAVWHWVC